MKSKNIKYAVATCVVLACTYIACKKVLDIPPPTQSEETYFKTEGEFRTAILGAYASLTDFYSSAAPGAGGNAVLKSFYLPGDDLTMSSSNSYEIFKGLNSSDGDLSVFFRSNYIMIGRANKVLEKVESAGDGVFTTPGTKDAIKGEALFLRSYAYYQLWNAFGTAPVVTETLKSLDELDKPSSTGTQLLDQAVTDLTAAATLLPATWSASDRGRVTANSANGLLGKVLVFRASANKSAADYNAAIAAFNKITGASLVTNFEDNFDYRKENNAESIFEYQAGSALVGAGGMNAWLANDACDCGTAGSYYLMFTTDGNNYMGGGLYTPTAKFVNAFEANDPRLPFTFTSDKSKVVKYVLNNQLDGGVNSINNYRVLRYADILLLKAEATLQGGGSTADAIGLINQVRTRARNMVAGGTVPANFNTTETNKTTIMNWIMDERLRELGAEGNRWWDIRRWAIGGTITLDNAYFSSNLTDIIKYDAHFLYFPIPDSEKSLNPNIVQNPGYN
ncbi:RagB/SusD family nutrient uptake outer membrane protein [Mucilaginibacter terrigena]|uniref:RagB/SusD family nutrient uptake outer membrane protein n=1 Tax=Mucilaginibacter terrigena TaxID=2492395 RepID=A0A4Q5LRN7_9SPHI|nr:RagB/SusD family nutrient uptake outer membrane protein [Mucilaginibacter terrigena]RYU92117.1 RagB/SusD family nutrient uptake outer membrane protein [Mucilaginibacter terrigena]